MDYEKDDKIIRLVREYITENGQGTLEQEPEQPILQDCCGQSCRPCVFDLHRDDIIRWAKQAAKKIKSKNEANKSLHEEIFGGEEIVTGMLDIEESPFSIDEYRCFELLSVSRLSVDTVLYRFRLNCNKSSLPFAASLRARLKNSDGKWISRLYTPTSITNHYFEVPIKIYNNGRMSKLWKNIEEGMNIEWMGPYNHQYLWQKLESDILLVAGGTGIAAFYRLIKSWISDDNSEFRIRIVICVHSKQHIIFAKEMASWAENWNISIIIYCSKAIKEDIFLPYHLKTKESRLTEEEFNQNFDTLANNGSSSTMVAVCACRSLSKDIVKFCMKRNIEEKRIIRFPT